MGLIQHGALIVAGKRLLADAQLHRLMWAGEGEDGAAKALLADPSGRHAKGGQSGGRIGHKTVGAADKHFPLLQPFDLFEVNLVQPPLEPLPVRIRLAQDQGEGHPLLRQGVQLAGGGNVRLAAAQVHEVHVAELPAQA